MIHVTPATQHYTYSNQDFDEYQALLCDLQKTPREYLAHTDGFVRSMTDWTMEYYKLRNLRPSIAHDHEAGRRYLRKLYQRLRMLTG